eukprot:TRINITY_DN1779_c10_g1_i1.p1 TRINITY_DN1779_c10_g1~~TRINITY_DN1779_c10_g1_i1.p1  ORF type:complete len:319 (+),score=37.12 TRINITY_DN1779_c10_g1_i1:60-1016(+)
MTELVPHSVVSLKGTDATPSLLYNNLTTLDEWVAFVHKNDVVVVNISKPNSPEVSHPFGTQKLKTAVYQVKSAEINGTPILFVVTQCGLIIWDLGKERMIAQCSVDPVGEIFLSRGIAFIQQGASTLIFVGHSNGNISVCDFDGESCSIVKTLSKNSDNISDIASGEAEGRQIVAAADISGEMHIWSEDLDHIGSISYPGDTISSIQIFSYVIACGFGSGHIKLYDNQTFAPCVTIAAHVRWINAISYSPELNMIASVSEDMLLCLWKMPTKSNGGKVQLAHHVLLKDCLLTGVQFIGDQVACTAYDWDRLYMFNVPE